MAERKLCDLAVVMLMKGREYNKKEEKLTRKRN
jgi:hypothetical protein